MRRTGALFLFALVSIPRTAWPQGDPLGSEFRINTYTTSAQWQPSVAADSSGNFVVVWHSNLQDGSSRGVFGQRSAASGVPLGPEFRVNTYTTDDQQDPSVAADSSGNFVVVWSSSQPDDPNGGVFGQRYASSGTPLGPEFRVNTYTTDSQFGPSVAADSSGNFVVVWSSLKPQYPFPVPLGIFGQRYASSGTPLGPEFRVDTYMTSFPLRPAVAADTSGNFVVVWTNYGGQDGSASGVFGQRYASSGAPDGLEFRVNTYTTDSQYGPSVASDASGNFVVVWTSYQDGYAWGVFGQRYASSGTPLGPEFRVNTHTTRPQRNSSVVADSSGNFVVVWDSDEQDGYFTGVFGQRYASSGTPLGPEFRVNTYTTSHQYIPSVASDSSGNFVVVWHGYGYTQDGSSFGVFGQRYGRIVPVELMRFTVE